MLIRGYEVTKLTDFLDYNISKNIKYCEKHIYRKLPKVLLLVLEFIDKVNIQLHFL